MESKISFQEHLLEELNKIVTEQQSQIDVLERRQQLLHDQLRELEESAGREGAGSAPQDERPPHY